MNSIFNRKIRYNKSWRPVNEIGETTFKDFNKRFDIDLTFTFLSLFKKYRIRFVKHPDLPDNYIRIYIWGLPRKIFFWYWDDEYIKFKYQEKIIDTAEVLTYEECRSKYGIII